MSSDVAGYALGVLFGLLSSSVWLLLFWYVETRRPSGWKTVSAIVSTIVGIPGIWFGGHVADTRSTDIGQASPSYIVALAVTFALFVFVPLMVFQGRLVLRMIR